MKVTTTQVSHDIVSSTPKPTKVPSQCKICGDRALQTYVGVMVCASCKMFFKRNAEADQAPMKCYFGGHCEINTLNRRICRCCRLKKCFGCGMQSDMFRAPFSKPTKTKSRKRATGTSELQQLPTLNLLRADQSTLSSVQWNLLSNLVHCYDEHSGLSAAARFVREQNALPIKARFKITGVGQMITSMMGCGGLLFEKNADFLSLSSQDRSLLLHGKLKYVGSLGAGFILRATRLYDNAAFCSAAEIIFGSETLVASKRASDHIDLDIIFVKLTLAIVLFSTLDYTVYMNAVPVNLENLQAVLRIQDTYTELAWRYLIYRYDFSYAVRCFSKIIRCIFNVSDALVEVAARAEFKLLVDGLIKQTEQVFVQ